MNRAAAFRLCFAWAIVLGCSSLHGAEPGSAEADAARARYQEIQGRQQTALLKLAEARRAAKTDEERRKATDALYPKPADYAPLYFEVAERFPGTPAAVDALVAVVKQTRSEPTSQQRALDLLRASYLESDRIGPVCQALVLSPADRADFLRAVAAKNPHHDVQGLAWLSLGQLLANTAGSDPQETEKTLRQAANGYDDVPFLQATVSEQARCELFTLQHLAVGQPAPEIVGSDVDGKTFKLSDYRGKVVVLDFWGRW